MTDHRRPTQAPFRACDQRATSGHRPVGRWLWSPRGDVPGWVLVSVMSAGLTAALWVLAEDSMAELLRRAVHAVAVP